MAKEINVGTIPASLIINGDAGPPPITLPKTLEFVGFWYIR